MRALLLATAFLFAAGGSAFAADAVAELPVASTYNWSGGYVGLTAGYGWGDSKFNDGGESNPFDIKGFIGGVTVGYNYQFNQNWVAGIEADLSYSGIKGSFGPGNLGEPGGGSWTCGSGACVTKVDWYSTVRGRIGYAFDNILVYGTGGLAVGHVKSGIDNSSSYQASRTNVGWTAGGGVEYAFNQNWTAKLEYLHVDLGWTGLSNGFFKSDAKFDAVRIGLNYKF